MNLFCESATCVTHLCSRNLLPSPLRSYRACHFLRPFVQTCNKSVTSLCALQIHKCSWYCSKYRFSCHASTRGQCRWPRDMTSARFLTYALNQTPPVSTTVGFRPDSQEIPGISPKRLGSPIALLVPEKGAALCQSLFACFPDTLPCC